MRVGRIHLAAVALFVVISALAWTALYRLDYGKPTRQSRWVAELYERKTRAADAISGPKIVLVGGSSVLFGLRADLLSRTFAVPAVNFGTHAGLDLDYILYRSMQVVRPGDMVLLCIEYEMLNGESQQVGEPLLEFALARDPGYLDSLPPSRQVEAVMMLSWSRALKPWTEPATREVRPFNPYYALEHLDAYGDTLGNATVLRWDGWRGRLAQLSPLRFAPTSSKLARLAEYVRWCRERGIVVLGVSPPLLEDRAYAGTEFRDKFGVVEEWFRVQRVPLLLRPAEAFRPVEVFFDTRYHLDSAAASAYTARVAEKAAPEVARWKARVAPAGQGIAPGGPTKVAGDFPLARLVRAFEGWEPLSGNGGFEDSNPLGGTAPVMWLDGAEAQMRVRANGEGAKRLLASISATAPGQVLSIAVAGRVVARCTLPREGSFIDLSAELGPARPFDLLTLREEGARPDASGHTALLQALRIVPSSSPATGTPCAAIAGG